MLKFVVLGVVFSFCIALPSRAALIGPGSEEGMAIGSIIEYHHYAIMQGNTLFAQSRLKTQINILDTDDQLIIDPDNPINWKWVVTFVGDLGSFDVNQTQYSPAIVQTLPDIANRVSGTGIFSQIIVVGINGVPIVWNFAEANLVLNPVVFESENATYAKFPNAVTGPFVRQEVVFTGHFTGDLASQIGAQYLALNPVPEPTMACVAMATGLIFLGFVRRAR